MCTLSGVHIAPTKSPRMLLIAELDDAGASPSPPCLTPSSPGPCLTQSSPCSPAVSAPFIQRQFAHGVFSVNFNHTMRSWLVIWEAGVMIELPPCVLLLYPSSLPYHFSIDVDGVSPGGFFFTHLTLIAPSHSVCCDRWSAVTNP